MLLRHTCFSSLFRCVELLDVFLLPILIFFRIGSFSLMYPFAISLDFILGESFVSIRMFVPCRRTGTFSMLFHFNLLDGIQTRVARKNSLVCNHIISENIEFLNS